MSYKFFSELYTCNCFCLTDLDSGRTVFTGKFKYNPVDVCVHEDVIYNFTVSESGDDVVEVISLIKMRELVAKSEQCSEEDVVQSDIIMQGQHPHMTFGKNSNESDYSYGTFCVFNVGLDD